MKTFREVVAETRYKPGWKFEVLGDFKGVPHLRITALVVDSNSPHTKITIDHVQPIHIPLEHCSEAVSRRYVAQLIDNVEAHELGEWLRFGDERPFLPFHGTEGDDDGDPYRRSW